VRVVGGGGERERENTSTVSSSSVEIPVLNIVSVKMFQHQVLSQQRYSSTKYTVSRDIPVPSIQSARIFQYQIFSQQGCSSKQKSVLNYTMHTPGSKAAHSSRLGDFEQQSLQSVPGLHKLKSAPGPPSSQSTSKAYTHVLSQRSERTRACRWVVDVSMKELAGSWKMWGTLCSDIVLGGVRC